MGREGYISVALTPSTMWMFDHFVREKGITKAAALQDLIETYMLVTDEELYLRLKKEILHTDAMKQLIAERTDRKQLRLPAYSFTGFWVRATYVDGMVQGQLEQLSPDEMLAVYAGVIRKNGTTWFSCNGPARNTGIGKERLEYIRSRINDGLPVQLFISVGEDYLWHADVLEVISGSEKIRLEDSDAVPKEFEFEENRTWFRITNLRLAKELTSSDLKFQNGSRVTDVMRDGQLAFGYVEVERK